MLTWLLTAALQAVVGNRADAGALRLVLGDRSWRTELGEVISRADNVNLDKKGFRRWLDNADTAEVLARYVGQEEPPEQVAKELTAQLAASGALRRPPGMTDGQWQAQAAEVVASTLVGLRLVTPEELSHLWTLLSNTTALRQDTLALMGGQVVLFDAMVEARDLFDGVLERLDLLRGEVSLLSADPVEVLRKVDAGGTPLRVFISSTSEMDGFPLGRSFVAAAMAGVHRAGAVAVQMATWTASDAPPAPTCAKRVQECDVYVGLIGFQYGTPVRDRPEVSYTELEYETAGASRLARLVFLLSEEAALPRAVAVDPRYGDRQDAFRAGLSASTTRAVFASPAELELLVYQALVEIAGPTPRDHDERASSGPVLGVPSGFRPSYRPTLDAFDRTHEEPQRDRELAELAGLVAAGGYVVVEGDAWAGKTALLTHLARTLERDGCRVVRFSRRRGLGVVAERVLSGGQRAAARPAGPGRRRGHRREHPGDAISGSLGARSHHARRPGRAGWWTASTNRTGSDRSARTCRSTARPRPRSWSPPGPTPTWPRSWTGTIRSPRGASTPATSCSPTRTPKPTSTRPAERSTTFSSGPSAPARTWSGSSRSRRDR